MELQAISLFISGADQLFGPMTTVRKNGRLVKHIPWSAFRLDDEDWQRVNDVTEILAVSCHNSYILCYLLKFLLRILLKFNINLRPKSDLIFNTQFPQLSSFKHRGKRRYKVHASCSTTIPLVMHLTKLRNITLVLIASHLLSSPWVC